MTKSGRSRERSAAPWAAAAEERQRGLGARLRQLYDDVVREPVPEDFLKLLEEAEKAEASRPGDAEGSEPR